MKHPREWTNNRMDIYMTRVIYPVGLGAFCIERFYDNSTNAVIFDAMYDCGSLSRMLGAIQYETEQLYAGSSLDLVCISHFDEDHINGFRKLLGTNAIEKGKTTILLPQIVDEQNVLELIGVEEYDNYSALKQDLSDYRVIEVLPMNKEFQRPEREELDIRDLRNEIESGTRITINDHLWEYIPFNNFNEERNNELLDDLMTKTRFDAQHIEEIHHGNITTGDLKKLKDAYRKLGEKEGDVTFINRNALMLLSKNNDKIHCSAHLLYSKDWIPTKAWIENNGTQLPFYERSCGLNPSCMYTGDSVMDQRMIEIQNMYMGGASIGLFQIPHHGSKHCYKQEIMDQLNIHAAFVNTNIHSSRVSIADELKHWQYNNIPALFWTLVGEGGIYEYIN